MPTRTCFAEALSSAGFHITRSKPRLEAQELVADLEIRHAGQRRPFKIDAELAAQMIDELPVLAVAATQAVGQSVIEGAGELRVKESDRLHAMEEGLSAMGADIVATEDGWVINGPRILEGAKVDSYADHRIAMALAVAGLVADGKTEIDGAESVDISYPSFFDDLESLC
jgi:3-phosphoshikimate 1-carboxyvinyltransferase